MCPWHKVVYDAIFCPFAVCMVCSSFPLLDSVSSSDWLKLWNHIPFPFLSLCVPDGDSLSVRSWVCCLPSSASWVTDWVAGVLHRVWPSFSFFIELISTFGCCLFVVYLEFSLLLSNFLNWSLFYLGFSAENFPLGISLCFRFSFIAKCLPVSSFVKCFVVYFETGFHVAQAVLRLCVIEDGLELLILLPLLSKCWDHRCVVNWNALFSLHIL